MDRPGAFWQKRFRELQDRYRRDDGTRWSAPALQRATGGAVKASWVYDLEAGRVRDPGVLKLRAVTRAMGVPSLDCWFHDADGAEA